MEDQAASSILLCELKSRDLERIAPLLRDQDVISIDDLRGLEKEDLDDFIAEYKTKKDKLTLGEKARLRTFVSDLRIEAKSQQATDPLPCLVSPPSTISSPPLPGMAPATKRDEIRRSKAQIMQKQSLLDRAKRWKQLMTEREAKAALERIVSKPEVGVKRLIMKRDILERSVSGPTSRPAEEIRQVQELAMQLSKAIDRKQRQVEVAARMLDYQERNIETGAHALSAKALAKAEQEMEEMKKQLYSDWLVLRELKKERVRALQQAKVAETQNQSGTDKAARIKAETRARKAREIRLAQREREKEEKTKVAELTIVVQNLERELSTQVSKLDQLTEKIKKQKEEVGDDKRILARTRKMAARKMYVAPLSGDTLHKSVAKLRAMVKKRKGLSSRIEALKVELTETQTYMSSVRRTAIAEAAARDEKEQESEERVADADNRRASENRARREEEQWDFGVQVDKATQEAEIQRLDQTIDSIIQGCDEREARRAAEKEAESRAEEGAIAAMREETRAAEAKEAIAAAMSAEENALRRRLEQEEAREAEAARLVAESLRQRRAEEANLRA